ncbi:hypothetical Protein YC6258_00331 [Gynuella sunshinyii YC6258]|uniref:Uncharacterized protein n=1 Tax=Gynuella sunshinyii YC6258 TaxID=1445510 RepID=A0A0C5VDU8_9GAMM|nr:hypothetical Protein YC6258_00331 [Gynuella sunshinyii YC6258]
MVMDNITILFKNVFKEKSSYKIALLLYISIFMSEYYKV